jgi:hypothetical protein
VIVLYPFCDDMVLVSCSETAIIVSKVVNEGRKMYSRLRRRLRSLR